MADAPEFTADDIEVGIARAIERREFDIIPGLMKLLALQDPARAQAVLDLVLDVARGRLTVTFDLRAGLTGTGLSYG